jgi:hypothetical protein
MLAIELGGGPAAATAGTAVVATVATVAVRTLARSPRDIRRARIVALPFGGVLPGSNRLVVSIVDALTDVYTLATGLPGR